MTNRLDKLERENAALREELENQWEENHFEHCGRTWPHASAVDCMWPYPEILLRQSEINPVCELQ
jgi:hypothetical protein